MRCAKEPAPGLHLERVKVGDRPGLGGQSVLLMTPMWTKFHENLNGIQFFWCGASGPNSDPKITEQRRPPSESVGQHVVVLKIVNRARDACFRICLNHHPNAFDFLTRVE